MQWVTASHKRDTGWCVLLRPSLPSVGLGDMDQKIYQCVFISLGYTVYVEKNNKWLSQYQNHVVCYNFSGNQICLIP